MGRFWYNIGNKKENMTEDFDKYYEAVEPGRRERAYAWATAIGILRSDRMRRKI